MQFLRGAFSEEAGNFHHKLVLKDFAAHPNVAAIFLDHGKPWQVGQTLKQPELAHTLELIEKGGARAYYDGPIARAIVAASERHGGILSLKDFRNYKAVWAKPVECAYRGYTIVTPPPPSSGVTVCEILRILAHCVDLVAQVLDGYRHLRPHAFQVLYACTQFAVLRRHAAPFQCLQR